jgi:hypothetical protein
LGKKAVFLKRIKMKALVISAKMKKFFLYFSGAVAIYSLLGFWVLPAVLSNQIPKIAEQNLGGRVTQVGDIKFNPFSMEFSIHGLIIKDLDDNTFVSFDRLYLNISLLKSIFDLSLSMDQISLEQPYVSVKRNKKGDFNFTDLLSEDTPEQEPSNGTIFPVSISKIAILKGKLSWEDSFYSKHQKEDIFPLNLTINDFSTKLDENSDLGFSLSLASGGLLEWHGQLGLNPLLSSGHIKLEKINFHKVWELFLRDNVDFEIQKGTERIGIDYQLSDSENGLQFVINNAEVDILDVKLSEKGQPETLMNIPDFKVSGIAFNLLNKTVAINKISANNAHFKAWLNADGSINYQSLFASDSEETQATQAKKAEVAKGDQPWGVTVKQLALNNFSLNFIDNSLPDPPTIDITSLNLNVTDINIKPGTSLPFKLSLAINQTGSLNLEGNTSLDPFSGNINVKAKDIAIKNFQPYINSALKLDVISGQVNIDTAVRLLQEQDKPLAVSLKGKSNISNLVTRDQVTNKDFLKWKQLSLENMDINLAENSYTIDKIKLEKLYTKILIRKDKTINIDDIVVKSNTTKDNTAVEKKQSETKQQPAKFKIKRIEFINGETDFSDLSLILPFSAHINRLKGSVTGISSEKNATIKVALNGRVANLAPVMIKGNINPDRGNSELTLDFKSMPLPLVTPYMAEFAGRKIEKGNMSLELKYKILNNKLTSSNKLLIEQLVLGDKVDNPEAVSLPLDLAIALLEDSSGKIALDVPITGSLDDPEFSVSAIVFDAFVNVITKIVTSPFNAIASLIGSDEDISQVIFLPGNPSLSEAEQNKLNSLATALIERPNLNLEIKGTAFSKQDWPLLQAEALDKQLLQIKADQLNHGNDKKTLAEHISLTEKEYQKLLADLFIQKHPELAERSLFGTPKLLDPKTGDFYIVAKEKLSAEIPPDPQRLKELAKNRAQSIANHLVEKGIAIEKIFILDVTLDPKESGEAIASIMTLTVN